MATNLPDDEQLVEEFLRPVVEGPYTPEAYAEKVEREFGRAVLRGRRIRKMVEDGWTRINTDTRIDMLTYLDYLPETDTLPPDPSSEDEGAA